VGIPVGDVEGGLTLLDPGVFLGDVDEVELGKVTVDPGEVLLPGVGLKDTDVPDVTFRLPGAGVGGRLRADVLWVGVGGRDGVVVVLELPPPATTVVADETTTAVVVVAEDTAAAVDVVDVGEVGLPGVFESLRRVVVEEACANPPRTISTSRQGTTRIRFKADAILFW
jgi:hypothetical protein